MPSPNIPDSNSSYIPPDPRPSQASQGSQTTQVRSRGSSDQSGSRRAQEGAVPHEEHRSKGSNSDREAEESRHPPSAGPPLPDKPTTKRKGTKDGHTRKRPGSASSSSYSSAEQTFEQQFEHLGHVVQAESSERTRTDKPSRSSTTDDSRPPGLEHNQPVSTAQNQVAVTTKGPRSVQNEARPSSTSSGPQTRDVKPTAQHSGRPPQAPVDTKPSYAKVVVDPAKTPKGPPQSGATDRRPGPVEAADLEAHFPGALLEVDIVQQGQHPEHVQQPHPHQGEVREAQGYGFGIGNAFRSLIPTGAPSPPRDKTKEELQKAISEINYLRMENKRAREEFRGLRHAYHEVDHERARLRDNNNSLQHELANVHRELEESKALSETRGRELVGAQVFLTKADSLSISDVADKVGVLNEEIFQAAASLAETLEHKGQDFPIEDMQRYRDQASRQISESMVNFLVNQAQQPEPVVNPLIVQAVLSIFLVGFCVSRIDSWFPDNKNLAGFLGQLYDDIRISEEQAVSGRWRALTRSRTRPSTEKWKTELIERLKCVLIVAAWDSPSDHQVAFEQKLVPIFKAVEDLRIALGEKFTSADLEVNVVRAGSKFEPWMEDAFDDGRQSGGKRASHEIVVGTTGIGLKKIVITRGSRGPEMFEPVVAPKVVLESTLREALEPPPQTKRVKKRKTVPEDGGDGGNPPLIQM